MRRRPAALQGVAPRTTARYPAPVREFSLPPSDEPVDFRRQAPTYGRYRRDYSAGLYDAIAARTGAAAGRVAVDLGCGTGFVTTSLRRRGWRAIGVDFSRPMLAHARAGAPDVGFVAGRAEALPVADAGAALLTCGTAFHWFPPAPSVAEIARVLAPGGHAALFWRYEVHGQPYMALIGEALRAVGVVVPDAFEGMRVHPEEPFAGSVLEPAPPVRIESDLEFTAESFHGYVATVEWLRRVAGERHADFLARLGVEIRRRFPGGFRERNEEFLFLARKPR